MRARALRLSVIGWVAVCALAVGSLGMFASEAQARDDDKKFDMGFVTFGSEINRGNFTPVADAPDPDRYSFSTIYWANFGAVLLHDSTLFQMNYSGISKLALSSYSTRHVSGTSTEPQGAIELGRGAVIMPLFMGGYHWKVGPGRLGVGGVLDIPGLSDGKGDTSWGFEGGIATFYILRAWRVRAIASLALSWFALTHPTKMQGGRFDARLDAYAPVGKLKWSAKEDLKIWLWGGVGYQTVGYEHPEEEGQSLQPDVELDAFSVRFGLGMMIE